MASCREQYPGSRLACSAGCVRRLKSFVKIGSRMRTGRERGQFDAIIIIKVNCVRFNNYMLNYKFEAYSLIK